jgi:hypothetical protein
MQQKEYQMAKVNNEKWEAYKSSIPGLASLLKPALTAASDSDIEYNSLTGKLPSDVLAKMVDTKHASSESTINISHHWCLCDMQEGDFPRVHVYPNLQSLTEAIAKREGKETAVWAMYGIPLQLTKPVLKPNGDKQRYLLLPNQMAVTVGSKEDYQMVEQSLLPAMDLEETGWLGNPLYLESQQFYTPGFVDDDQFSEEQDEE